MAAVICSSFGEICSVIGSAICFPCRLCGMGCAGCGDALKSPFFPYLAVTFALNMPGLIYGIRSLLDPKCPKLSGWLVINAFFAVIHMVAAWYIVSKIRESNPNNNNKNNNKSSTNDDPEEGQYYTNFDVPKENEHGAKNSCSRIKHVLCYDKTMALYIVTFVIWIVWLSIGITRRLAVGAGGCGDEVHYVNIVIACGYMFMSMVGMAFACSLCCLR